MSMDLVFILKWVKSVLGGALIPSLWDSAAFLMLNEQQIYFFGQIQTNQTGGQPDSETFP